MSTSQQTRNSNGRFGPKPAPELSEHNAAIYSRHQATLTSLSAELGALKHLHELWQGAAEALKSEEAGMEETVSAILGGSAGDADLASKSVRAASLTAQIGALRKRAVSAGTVLQKRLPLDIASVEWLVKNWLLFRLEAERDKLLLTVSISQQKSELLQEAAHQLARSGTSYQKSEAELGPPVLGNYQWSRPLEVESEKSWVSQRLINDPLYKPVDPLEIISEVLKAGSTLEARWQKILASVTNAPEFEAPSYEEPVAEIWSPTREQAGVVSGEPRPGLEEAPAPFVARAYFWDEKEGVSRSEPDQVFQTLNQR